jgi:hypothetical protein
MAVRAPTQIKGGVMSPIQHRCARCDPLLTLCTLVLFLAGTLLLVLPASALARGVLASGGSGQSSPQSAPSWATTVMLPLVVQKAQLTASDGASLDEFGNSVALSGDTALVGASSRTVGGQALQGAAYIFTNSNGIWTQQGELIAGDGTSGDEFGASVALYGDTALVGAPFHTVNGNSGQGVVYVFARSGTTWSQQAILTAGTSLDEFGSSVALSGDTALVGALGSTVGGNSSRGAAYVFTRSGTSWTQQQQLTAGDGGASDYLGSSVALDGDTALIGAPSHNLEGAAYVFARSGTSWGQQGELTAADGALGSDFGCSVALSGDSALVGAWNHAVGSTAPQGAAYVFTRSSTTWSQQAELTAKDAGGADAFGASVALAGDTALVGAYAHLVNGNPGQGAAYVFTRSGTNWTQQQELMTAGDGAYGDDFGSAVALDSDTALVGAWGHQVGNNRAQGAAYCFGAPAPTPTPTPTPTPAPRPTTIGSAHCRVHGKVTLRYRIGDTTGASDTATIFIARRGKVIRTVKLGKQATDKDLAYTFRCPLKRGRYSWWISATNGAGRTGKSSPAKLIVS